MSNTPCECPFAGWCERHGMEKRRRQHELCQTNLRYWNKWEKGEGGATVKQSDDNQKNSGIKSKAKKKSRKSSRLSCQHRGDVIREEKCRACSNRFVNRPVYSCEIHGECMLGSFVDGIKSCKKCNERQEVK